MASRWKARAVMVGVAVSAILLGLFITRLDWHEFQGAFRGLQWGWVLVACLGIALSVSTRAVRWFLIADGRPVQLGKFWDATMMGYVGNALYPGRAGEVLRIAVLRHATSKPFGRVVATAMADRMADVVALCVVALYLIGIAAQGFETEGLLLPVVLTASVPLLGLLLAVRFGSALSPFVNRFAAPFPRAWQERIPRWYAEAMSAIAELTSVRRLAGAVGLTAVACALDYAMLWSLLRAFDWSLPFHAAMLVSVLLALGSLVPAAPGYVGIYQVACVVALKAYGVAEASALAYSVVAQGATLLVVALLGAVAGIRYGSAQGKVTP